MVINGKVVSIKEYAREGRPYWFVIIRYRCNVDGKTRQKIITSDIPVKGHNKTKAKAWGDEIVDNYKQHEKNKVDTSKNTNFMDFLIKHLETARITGKIQDTTYDGYIGYVNKHIGPYFEGLGLTVMDIEPMHIQNLVNDLLGVKKLHNNSVRQVVSIISGCLESAVRQNIIAFNPAKRIVKPKKLKFNGARPLNENEIREVIEMFKGDPMETAVLVTVFYGLRRSEIRGLRWRAIDFDKNTISIEHSIVRVQGKTHYKDVLKTDSSYALLPMPEYIKSHPLSWRSKQQGHKLLQPNDYIDSDYICTDFDGGLLTQDFFTDHFRLIMRKNGYEGVRFHDLRHSAGNYLKSLGVHGKDIQEWLRHSSYQTTFDMYLKSDMKDKEVVSSKLGDMYSGFSAVE